MNKEKLNKLNSTYTKTIASWFGLTEMIARSYCEAEANALIEARAALGAAIASMEKILYENNQ